MDADMPQWRVRPQLWMRRSVPQRRPISRTSSPRMRIIGIDANQVSQAGRGGMFGWSRKKDGFEWHDYVRTTIKLRREDRRARLLDVKEVAADGLKYAGRASVSAGSSGAVMAWNGLISAIQMMIRGAIAGGNAMARTAENKIAPAGRSFLTLAEPWLKRIGGSPLMLLLGFIGLTAFHAAFARSRGGGAVAETILIAVVGTLTLVAAVAPWFSGHARMTAARSLRGAGDSLQRSVPGLARLSKSQRRGLGLAALAALVVGGGYIATRATPTGLIGLGGFNPFAARVIEGRATALGGDAIRIDGTAIRLAGIEAPEADQKCTGANKKKWSCGEAAQSALQRIIKAKTVRCEVSGMDAAGRPLGTCQSVNTGNAQDVAAALVKEGVVFADGGLFTGYAAFEAEAKAKKLGLWRGEVERPADYRAKLWDAAAKSAPDGCPIKGQISGDAKSYVLPWSPDYAGARVRAARGERWFCTEGEAQAAGFKLATR